MLTISPVKVVLDDLDEIITRYEQHMSKSWSIATMIINIVVSEETTVKEINRKQKTKEIPTTTSRLSRRG